MARINRRRIAVSLLVGVVVTVLSAWILPHFDGWTPRSTGSASKAWPIRVPIDWPSKPRYSIVWIHRTETITRHYVFADGSKGVVPYEMIECRAGWPFRALVRYSGYEPSPGTVGPGWNAASDARLSPLLVGLSIPPQWLPSWLPIERPLPLAPLWLGFVANTLFYGCLCWPLLISPVSLRRHRRARRGLCIKCAYPVAGLNLCPECGTATPQAMGRESSASDAAGVSREPSPRPSV